MRHLRFASVMSLGLLATTSLVGCFGFGSPFDKGDGSGTGTGRPGKAAVDMGKTGGLGSPQGEGTIGPGELGQTLGSAPDVGPK